ncbi:MAG: GDP-mannose 4,6-dehydratase [Candidatus Niyogibacteria bacterium]|nr:GDP-mannose 4,6-dehydratase [Candidatus Niyogibacteria bacterium]
MTKKALITGITGQDGSYLTELLLEKGYEVYGVQRRASMPNTQRIDHVSHPNLYMMYGDLSDSSNLTRILYVVKPDEIYNLAAQSHVRISFDKPEYTVNVNALGPLRILETIRTLGLKTKYYQASSSEMFGKVLAVPQNEITQFNPQSPYGLSKVFAFYITKIFREGYGIFASNGILFNHESPRRGFNFVTRKITLGLSNIKLGIQPKLMLGNLDAKRDWGHSKDYVEAMWKILQHDKPDDFVIATGETHTVREFVEGAAKHLDIEIAWTGSGLDEKGIDKITGKTIIEIDPKHFRPNEVDLLLGDAAKAREVLGWQPRVTFSKLTQMMIEEDFNYVSREAKLKNVHSEDRRFHIS